jgi:hypothetical protein
MTATPNQAMQRTGGQPPIYLLRVRHPSLTAPLVARRLAVADLCLVKRLRSEMNPNEELSQSIDALMGGSLIQQAEIEILLSLCRQLAERLGIDPFHGLSAVDWFQREKLAQLEATLIEMEDKNPTTAAYLQQIIDESRKRIGDLPPEP